MIIFHNCQQYVKLNRLITARTINAMIIAAGYRKWDLTVSFIEDTKMKELNAKYRKKDSTTDILSFPTHTHIHTPGQIEINKHTIHSLGDIFISLPYVQAYCLENNVAMDSHLPILYAHGISHLLGFDHESDEDFSKMDPFEKRILGTYSKFMEEYDPMEEGLYESWNWSSDLDV